MSARTSQLGRRGFLKLGGMSLVISALDPSFVRARGDARLGRIAGTDSGKTFIYCFQRFGADGLNILTPYESGEHALYMSYRPRLGIPRSELAGQTLDADFALTPLVRDTLYPLWQAGQVAVFPNVGYPNGSRSHFDGQFFLDNGTPWIKTTPDGWLNRYLQLNPVADEPLRAVAFSSGLPFSLSGPAPSLSFTDLGDLAASQDPTRDERFLTIQQQVYTGHPTRGRTYDQELGDVGTGLIDAIYAIRQETLPAPGATYPDTTFGRSMLQLAQLLKTGSFGIEVAEVDIDGWDTHANQALGNDPLSGLFANLVTEMFDTLYAFVNDVGPTIMENTVILTSSEFGRTARENGNLGTDHGSGWASFAIGGASGPVRPGIYMGPEGWHGLDDLRDNRDLKHSIDFRDLHTEALSSHLGGTLDDRIFPGWTSSPVGYL